MQKGQTEMPRSEGSKELPDHVTYDASQSSLPRVLVWTLALVGIPSPKRRDLRRDAQQTNGPDQP
jgi:hypothetical protein